jgi:Family of unknown function (DUF5995)
MSANDEKLRKITSAKSVTTFDDVISVLQSLDREISTDDGLKWFNLLYQKVTEGVRNQSATLHWENAKWLERLDVIFAKLYFAAITDWHDSRTKVARSWLPLFESRNRRGIMRVQFAFAGINAHINHDLPIALVQTDKELLVTPRRGTAEFRDFEKINGILELVMENTKQFIATGIVGLVDGDLGRLDDRLANWGVRKARETAWSNSEILWRLNRVPGLPEDFLVNLDRLVSLSSRGLLAPVGKF